MATPAPASTAEAMDMVLTGLRYLAAADPTALAAQAQAECLQTFEQADAMSTAVRARFLAAFTAGQGYSEDADYSPTSWLIHRTRITKGAARGHLGWARRAARASAGRHGAGRRHRADRVDGPHHLRVDRQASAADCRPAADEILLAAARPGPGGRTWPGWPRRSTPARCPIRRTTRSRRSRTARSGSRRPSPAPGSLSGDLTPECAAVVTAVLESLSAPMGAEDTRTREQRYHDGLQDAMRRLVASGLLPERAGQPVKVWAHVSLAELRAMDDGSVLQTEWVTEMRVRWAARRAEAADGRGSDGAAWLDGDAARAVACDAMITPVVTGDVDPGALDDLVRLCLQLAGHGAHCAPRPGPDPADPAAPDPASPDVAGRTGRDPGRPSDPPAGPAQLTAMAREALQQAIIGKVADLLSGPGGLASFLRTRQLGARLAGPSLPLDIGYAATIPAGIRNAVIVRDRRCRWPGGCNQPAAACEVHHVRHKAHGGPTSLGQCVLLCSYHHQVVIHRWGWTLVLQPGRDHHRVEPGPDQGAAQPQAQRPPGPRRVNHPRSVITADGHRQYLARLADAVRRYR